MKENSFEKFIADNPVFVLAMGLCPAIAVTNTFEGAYVIGIIVLLTTLISNLIAASIVKIVSKKYRIHVCLIVTAILVSFWELLLNNYVHDMYQTLGIYLSLIAVNFMIMQRAIFFAFHNGIKKSFMDGLKMGLSFTLIISLLGLIREFLGSNTITFIDKLNSLTGTSLKYLILPTNDFIPNTFFVTPAGAFITLGIILSIINVILIKRGEKK